MRLIQAIFVVVGKKYPAVCPAGIAQTIAAVACTYRCQAIRSFAATDTDRQSTFDRLAARQRQIPVQCIGSGRYPGTVDQPLVRRKGQQTKNADNGTDYRQFKQGQSGLSAMSAGLSSLSRMPGLSGGQSAFRGSRQAGPDRFCNATQRCINARSHNCCTYSIHATPKQDISFQTSARAATELHAGGSACVPDKLQAGSAAGSTGALSKNRSSATGDA